ncbi:hypothetical protein GQ42DRAFT_152893 [Ramicandelaber brevisporus]|nr:hypothetical protein GQ42DRAFT_152893 [Ramicandelaber brevisporus]
MTLPRTVFATLALLLLLLLSVQVAAEFKIYNITLATNPVAPSQNATANATNPLNNATVSSPLTIDGMQPDVPPVRAQFVALLGNVTTAPMYDFFGSFDVPDYTIVGPVVTLSFEPGCVAVLNNASLAAASERLNVDIASTFNATILFANGKDMRDSACDTASRVIAKLPALADQVKQTLRLPPVALLVISASEPSTAEFGGPEAERSDDYQLVPIPKDINLAYIGSDTGTLLTKMSTQSGLLVALATHDIGPWNRMHTSAMWMALRIIVIIANCLVGLYGLYRFVTLLIETRFSLVFKAYAYAGTLYVIIMSTIVRQGEVHTRLVYVFCLVGWGVGIFLYNWILCKWVVLMQRIHFDRTLRSIMMCTAVLNCVVFEMSVLVLAVGIYPVSPVLYKAGGALFSFVNPVLFYIQAVCVLVAAVLYMRRIDAVPLTTETRYRLVIITKLLYWMIFGWFVFATAIILTIIVAVRSPVFFALKSFFFQLGVTVAYGAIFMILHMQSDHKVAEAVAKRNATMASGTNGMRTVMSYAESADVPQVAVGGGGSGSGSGNVMRSVPASAIGSMSMPIMVPRAHLAYEVGSPSTLAINNHFEQQQGVGMQDAARLKLVNFTPAGLQMSISEMTSIPVSPRPASPFILQSQQQPLVTTTITESPSRIRRIIGVIRRSIQGGRFGGGVGVGGGEYPMSIGAPMNPDTDQFNSDATTADKDAFYGGAGRNVSHGDILMPLAVSLSQPEMDRQQQQIDSLRAFKSTVHNTSQQQQQQTLQSPFLATTASRLPYGQKQLPKLPNALNITIPGKTTETKKSNMSDEYADLEVDKEVFIPITTPTVSTAGAATATAAASKVKPNYTLYTPQLVPNHAATSIHILRPVRNQPDYPDRRSLSR